MIESDVKRQISCSDNVVLFFLRIIICVIRVQEKKTKQTNKTKQINNNNKIKLNKKKKTKKNGVTHCSGDITIIAKLLNVRIYAFKQ